MEPIKPKTQSFGELCEMYGVSETTMRRWLKMHNLHKNHKKYYTPKEVAAIYDKLGEP